MPKKVSPIPAGYHSLTPYFIVKDAVRAIDFYKKAFGAKEALRMKTPEGRVMHAELKIGDSVLMLADECQERNYLSPLSYKGTPVSILLYVENVDAAFDKAVKAGAKVERPVTDMFYGDRAGHLLDPFGHSWCLASRKETLTMAQINERAKELFSAPVKA